MCGIVGFINQSRNKEEIIKKMNLKIAHRGLDGEGYYIDDLIAIGHRRLSIVDINGGKQPMKKDNLVIAYNGEIYNFNELKAELINLKHTFKTNCDTEVIIHGYEEWGYELPKKLRGMFAFVIWDNLKKELFCVRDNFGIKPLYYYQEQNTFMFASEIKAFLAHPTFKKVLNKDLLSLYLSFSFTPTSETFFKGVYSLEPGTYLIVKNNKIIKEKYYQIDFAEQSYDFKDLVKKINVTITESVHAHTLGEEEIGTFLSSGIDSSYITSILKPNKTYTIGYDEKEYSEIDYAKELASKLRINNYCEIINKEDYFKIIPKIMYHLEEPTADASIPSLYYLAKRAREDVKVVLSGEGADEFFAGYNSYQEEIKHHNYLKIPGIFRQGLANVVKFLPDFRGRNFLIRMGSPLEKEYVGVGKLFSEQECKKVLNFIPPYQNKEITKDVFQKFSHKDNLIKKQAIDINFWLVKDILLKVDKMTMAHSLEARCPFVDIEVFNLAKKIPSIYKVNAKETKIALRSSSQNVIPTKAFQKKKWGFPVPLNKWLQEDDVYNLVKDTFQKRYVPYLFNQKYILKLLDQHKIGKRNNYKKIWAIYTFLKWYEVFFLSD